MIRSGLTGLLVNQKIQEALLSKGGVGYRERSSMVQIPRRRSPILAPLVNQAKAKELALYPEHLDSL